MNYENQDYETARREVKEFIKGTERAAFLFSGECLNEMFMRFYDSQHWDEKQMLYLILKGVAEYHKEEK